MWKSFDLNLKKEVVLTRERVICKYLTKDSLFNIEITDFFHSRFMPLELHNNSFNGFQIASFNFHIFDLLEILKLALDG
jgi:hypothetical protein